MAINGNETPFPTLPEGSPIRLNLPKTTAYLLVEYRSNSSDRKRPSPVPSRSLAGPSKQLEKQYEEAQESPRLTTVSWW